MSGRFPGVFRPNSYRRLNPPRASALALTATLVAFLSAGAPRGASAQQQAPAPPSAAAAVAPAPAPRSPAEAEAPPPAPSLMAFAPPGRAAAYLVRGAPSDVFPKLVELPDLRPGPAVKEGEWLRREGVKYEPPARDAILAPDYAAAAPGPAMILHLDRLTTGSREQLPGVSTVTFREGRAEISGLTSGPYCLIAPGGPGEPALALAVEVGEGPSVAPSEGWAPLTTYLYLAAMGDVAPETFWTSLSPQPFAQINSLIRRLRSTVRISAAELALFYRGYYEALSLAHWLETAPDSNLYMLVERLEVSDSRIDQLALEAARQEDWLRRLEQLTRLARDERGEPVLMQPEDAGALTAGAPRAEELFQTPSLARYRSLYYTGMGAFFLTEAEERRILSQEGHFIHPDLARLYTGQNLFLARQRLEAAAASDPGNPYLPVLRERMAEVESTAKEAPGHAW